MSALIVPAEMVAYRADTQVRPYRPPLKRRAIVGRPAGAGMSGKACKGGSRTAPTMADMMGRIEAFPRWSVGTREKMS
ncbi:MAG: hypothetical protein D3918_15210 [Candidatus Electrothrix sp. AX2]|nr:hypothetical protein [Candidatus Electrothrix gigas]